MTDLLLPPTWLTWLLLAGSLEVGVILGALAYSALAVRVFFEGRGCLRALPFDRFDLAVAAGLTSLLVLLAVAGFQSPKAPVTMDPHTMILGTVLSAAVPAVLIGGILASLAARHVSWRQCFWPAGLGPAGVVVRGGALLLAGLPLVTGAVVLSRVLLAAVGYIDDSPQDIVSFLEHNQSHAAQWTVAIFAVTVAPMQEEFIFRGYLYGIMRRYAGPLFGLLLNSALFAAIHVHLPSFGGLFVLAACLTLAYEWSGSIFVPMTMHALFNALSLVQMFNGGASGW